MSHIYDNWERLVAAAVKKQQLWELFHAQSRSPSTVSDSSSFSFCQSSSLEDDVPFGFSIVLDEDYASCPKEDFGYFGRGLGCSSCVLAGGQTPISMELPVPDENVATSIISMGLPVPDENVVAPIISMELPVPDKNVSLAHRRRKNLIVEVPKPSLQDLNQPCRNRPKDNCIPERMTSPPVANPSTHKSASVRQSNWSGDGKRQRHPLPLPPVSKSCPNSPFLAHSPRAAENVSSPLSWWKKGELLCRGSFGNVYRGFNRETGEMCAMKEFTLSADDANSQRSAKKLEQDIMVLSRLRHPNIVQYYGSEMVGEKLYVYFEYVSGGSIGKILQDYGKLGETAIRSYTQQILSGLAYLHSKSTVHRNLKASSVLVDPSGSVKLANFGIAKHITRQSDPLTFAGSTYWMPPEVIKNANGCNQAVDIWSLGCTVLEMATSRPPWSQHKPVMAVFKIIQAKELPEIPDHLCDECKHFIRICLQWNPLHRPTASQLLEHPFVKTAAVKPVLGHASPTNSKKSMVADPSRSLHQFDPERLAVYSARVSKPHPHYSDLNTPRNISCPVSPVGSPIVNPRSPRLLNGRTSPPPFFTPHPTSGSSTPSTYMTSGSSTPSSHMTSGSPTPGNNLHYWDPNILQGMLSGPHPLPEKVSYDNLYPPNQIGIPSNGKLYEHSILADRVSQRLLRNPVKMNTSFQFSPPS